jgi:hypothetical protein
MEHTSRPPRELDLRKAYDTKDGDLLPKNVLFGVEMEIIVPTRRAVDDLHKNLPAGVHIGTDGSIRSGNGHGLELRLPPISGASGEKLIRRVCKEVNDVEGYVNQSCGLHVHLDASDLKGSQVVSLMHQIVIYEPTLFSLLPQTRRGNQFCKRLAHRYSTHELDKLYHKVRDEERRLEWGILEGTNTSDAVVAEELMRTVSADPSFKRKTMLPVAETWYEDKRMAASILGSNTTTNHGHDSRYFGLNLHCLFAQGHYEIRYHSGTTNPQKILNWIALHAALLNKARTGYDFSSLLVAHDRAKSPAEEAQTLFKHLALRPTTRKYFLKRQRMFMTATDEVALKVGRKSVK